MQQRARPDVAGFLALFERFGARASVETYLPLFHPEATLFDAGMERPITVAEIPEHIEGILKLVPDFEMVPRRWRERGGTLFVEAGNRATLGNGSVSWPSVYCMNLEGDRVLRGRRYYDRRPLYAQLAPDLPALPDVAPGPHDWRLLALLLPDLTLELQHWAGDAELLFIEWRARASVAGSPIALGIVERVDLVAGSAPDAHSYFDTLELANRLAVAA